MLNSKLLFLLLPLALVSCSGEEENEDLTHDVNKNGSVETSVQVTHIDSTHDLLTTTHKIWVQNSVYKTTQHLDTLPALGIEHTVAENSDGETKPVSVKKDYEIYITVK
jgi:hypothetical protein